MARLSAQLLAILFALAFVAEQSTATMMDNTTATYHLDGPEGSLRPEECPGACSYRCSKTAYRKRCLFFCIMCCKKCLCVPSGTYGHKDECPCYRDWKTKKGGPKCP